MLVYFIANKYESNVYTHHSCDSWILRMNRCFVNSSLISSFHWIFLLSFNLLFAKPRFSLFFHVIYPSHFISFETSLDSNKQIWVLSFSLFFPNESIILVISNLQIFPFFYKFIDILGHTSFWTVMSFQMEAHWSFRFLPNRTVLTDLFNGIDIFQLLENTLLKVTVNVKM